MSEGGCVSKGGKLSLSVSAFGGGCFGTGRSRKSVSCMGVVVLRRVDDSYDDVRGVAWIGGRFRLDLQYYYLMGLDSAGL